MFEAKFKSIKRTSINFWSKLEKEASGCFNFRDLRISWSLNLKTKLLQELLIGEKESVFFLTLLP